MAQKNNDKPRTRRAERRKGSPSEGAARADSTTGDEDDGDEDDGDEDDGERGEEAAAAPLTPPPANRAARRAQQARARTATAEDRRDEIRDRNRRTRQEAAERRRSRRQGPSPETLGGGLDASERVDDALARLTFRVSKWVRKHSLLVQVSLVAAFVGMIGWTVFRYLHARSVAARSEHFFAALARVGAPVGEPADVLNPDGNVDPRPTFASDEERLQQAIAAYDRAIDAAGSRPLGLLASLGKAGALLEAGEYDQARSLYETVSAADSGDRAGEVRGRALEGIGLALEAKGDLEGALKAYQTLENLGVDRFTQLALYHRARVHHAKQEDKTAQELLTDLTKRLGPPDSPMNPGYLRVAAQELMLAIDPNTALAGAGGPGEIASGADVEAMQKQLEELLKQAQQPSAPAAPVPADDDGAAP